MATKIDDDASGAANSKLVSEQAVSPIHHSNDWDESSTEGEVPNEDEFHTLRRISDKIPWRVYTIAFVELCERFSYYGTTVVFTNFIQQPLPPGSKTGA